VILFAFCFLFPLWRFHLSSICNFVLLVACCLKPWFWKNVFLVLCLHTLSLNLRYCTFMSFITDGCKEKMQVAPGWNWGVYDRQQWGLFDGFFDHFNRMKALCMHIGNEVNTDIKIHNQHILPRYRSWSNPWIFPFSIL